MTPKELMAYAIDVSRREMRAKGLRPYVALIVKDGQIVAEGCNDSVSSHDPTGHGEVVAIRNATSKLGREDLSGHEIYTTCEPCPLCVAAIWWAKLDRMYYAATLDDCADIGIDIQPLIDEVRRPVTERKLETIPLLRAESRDVLEEWSKTPAFKLF